MKAHLDPATGVVTLEGETELEHAYLRWTGGMAWVGSWSMGSRYQNEEEGTRDEYPNGATRLFPDRRKRFCECHRPDGVRPLSSGQRHLDPED